MARNIYNWGKDPFKKELQRLEKSNITKRNKELIISWSEILEEKDCTNQRIIKICMELRKLAKFLEKDFTSANVEDLKKLVRNINKKEDWSSDTKSDYRKLLKRFYRWLIDESLIKNNEEAIILDKYIKTIIGAPKPKKIDYSEILTEDDIRSLINSCNKIRDKAFIKVLYEGGFRIGEHLGIQIKDLEISSDSIIIQVDGKTGKRRVPLYLSVNYIKRWLEEHPSNNDPKAYLWVSQSGSSLGKPLAYQSSVKILKKTAKKAGIKKNVNPHWFRHSIASQHISHLNSQLMCEYFGWVGDTRQLKTYVHVNPEQVDHALRKARGLKIETNKKLENHICPVCHHDNIGDSKFCSNCGKPLSLDAIKERDDIIKDAMNKFAKIMSDPILKQKYEEFSNSYG
jgi:integrase/recombinase XerD